MLRVPNIMRRVMRCHDFRSGREASRSQYREYWQGERQSHGRKLVPALRVTAKIAARRSVEQGSAQRGAGTRLRDATVKPIIGRVTLTPILCAFSGSHPKGTCSSLRRARLRDATAEAQSQSRVFGALYVPTAGSHPSIERLEPAPPSAGPTILVSNAHVPHYVRHSQ